MRIGLSVDISALPVILLNPTSTLLLFADSESALDAEVLAFKMS